MALAPSHPFRLAAVKPRPKLRSPKFAVHAKKDPPFSFNFGKFGGSSGNDAPTDGGEISTGRNFFDFNGKLPEAAKSLVPVISSPSRSLLGPGLGRKDPNTVFVAGASGQVGVRIAQTLLRQGFAVRAGVSDLGAAQELAQLAVKYKFISPEESRRLNAVQSPVGDAEAVARAIGNASKVVVTVGRGENGPTGAITAEDALEVVRAAQLSGARHVVLVYDAAGSVQSTYNVLDGFTSFFSNLFSLKQPLTFGELVSKVAETDVGYTVVKAALTEDYAAEGGYGIVVGKEGSGGGSTASANVYNVSKSQIASFVADIFSNVEFAENKVVEVSTSPSATSKSIEELFSLIPKDGRREAYKEALEKAKAEEEARDAAEKLRKAAVAAKKLEEEDEKPSKPEPRASTLTDEAREKVNYATVFSLNGDVLRRATEGLNVDFSWEKLSSQLQAVAKVSKGGDGEPKVQVATVRGQAKARTLPPRKAVVKPPAPKKAAAAPPPKRETEVRKVFGGLFKQETIYIDDD